MDDNLIKTYAYQITHRSAPPSPQLGAAATVTPGGLMLPTVTTEGATAEDEAAAIAAAVAAAQSGRCGGAWGVETVAAAAAGARLVNGVERGMLTQQLLAGMVYNPSQGFLQQQALVEQQRQQEQQMHQLQRQQQQQTQSGRQRDGLASARSGSHLNKHATMGPPPLRNTYPSRLDSAPTGKGSNTNRSNAVNRVNTRPRSAPISRNRSGHRNFIHALSSHPASGFFGGASGLALRAPVDCLLAPAHGHSIRVADSSTRTVLTPLQAAQQAAALQQQQQLSCFHSTVADGAEVHYTGGDHGYGHNVAAHGHFATAAPTESHCQRHVNAALTEAEAAEAAYLKNSQISRLMTDGEAAAVPNMPFGTGSGAVYPLYNNSYTTAHIHQAQQQSENSVVGNSAAAAGATAGAHGLGVSVVVGYDGARAPVTVPEARIVELAEAAERARARRAYHNYHGGGGYKCTTDAGGAHGRVGKVSANVGKAWK